MEATHTQEYVPFGAEWEKEMMKVTKPVLVGFVKAANKKRIHFEQLNEELLEALENYAKCMERFMEKMPEEYVVGLLDAVVVQGAHKQALSVIAKAKGGSK